MVEAWEQGSLTSQTHFQNAWVWLARLGIRLYSFGVQGGRNSLGMRLATVSLLSLWFTDCSSLISRPCEEDMHFVNHCNIDENSTNYKTEDDTVCCKTNKQTAQKLPV